MIDTNITICACLVVDQYIYCSIVGNDLVANSDKEEEYPKNFGESRLATATTRAVEYLKP